MANNIKGLTVEIGGDTTKLGKALEDVNKKGRNLSGELGEINRLLKLDPGNTELLTQKQKVLAEAVANTGKKLETLKEAEKQVQEQFKRGEVSEEQVRALQREIVATEQKMESYEKAVKETEDALNGVAKESKEVGDSSEGMGKKMANAAKVGLQAVAAAATAVVGALVGAAEATRDYRMDMGKLNTVFETANWANSAEKAQETYSALVGVLGESDQAVEASAHLAKLAFNSEELATWTDICTGVYATFGDSLPIEGLTEAANETAEVGKVTGSLADALNWVGVSEDAFNESLAKCATEQERVALITNTLNGLYGEAAEKYKETNAEVIRANQANDAWMSSMAGVGAAIEPVLTDVKMMGASLLAELVPGVEAVSEAFSGMLNGDEGAAGDLGDALGGIITDLLNKVAELAPTIVEVGVSLITSLTTTLVSMLPQLVTTGITLLTTILDGLTSAVPQLLAAVVAVIPQLVLALVNGIPQLVLGAVQFFLAIVQAIPQILPPLIAALPTIIDSITTTLVGNIPLLLDAAVELFMALVQAIPVIVLALIEALPSILTSVTDFLSETWTAIVTWTNDLGADLDAWLATLPGLFWGWLSGVIANVVAWGSNIVSQAKTAASNFLSNVTSTLSGIPAAVAGAISSAITNVVTWGTNMVSSARTAMSNVVTNVTSTLSTLPSKVLSIGSNLVTGLWNGISNKVSWLTSKISGFVSTVMANIKSFFGVHSPSTETAWVGEMLDEGLAEGMLDHMKTPVKAMQKVTTGVLGAAEEVDGLALTRQLQVSTAATTASQMADSGLLGKLDRILSAIEAGHIIALDGEALVGATYERYDMRMGQRRQLAERGALA